MFDLREISVIDRGDVWASSTLAGKRQKPSLFQRADMRGGRSVYLSRFCPKGHSFYVGRASATSEAVAGWVGRMGAGLLRVSRDCLAPSWIAHRAEAFDFIIVDADVYECGQDAKRVCEALHQYVPLVPKVLLTKSAPVTANGVPLAGVTECNASDEAAFVRALRLAREGCPCRCTGATPSDSPLIAY